MSEFDDLSPIEDLIEMDEEDEEVVRSDGEEMDDVEEANEGGQPDETTAESTPAGNSPDMIYCIQYPTKDGKIGHGATDHWRWCRVVEIIIRRHKKKGWAVLAKWNIEKYINVENRYTYKAKKLVEDLAAADGGLHHIEEDLSITEPLADFCTQGLWEAFYAFENDYVGSITPAWDAENDDSDDEDDSDIELRDVDTETPDSLHSLFHDTPKGSPKDTEMQEGGDGEDSDDDEDAESGVESEDEDGDEDEVDE